MGELRCEDCRMQSKQVCLRQGDMLLCNKCNEIRFPPVKGQTCVANMTTKHPQIEEKTNDKRKTRSSTNKKTLDMEDETQLKTACSLTPESHCCCKTLLPVLENMMQELSNLRKISMENKEENEMLLAKLMSLSGPLDDASQTSNNPVTVNENQISPMSPDESNISTSTDYDSTDTSETESESEKSDENTIPKQPASQPVVVPNQRTGRKKEIRKKKMKNKKSNNKDVKSKNTPNANQEITKPHTLLLTDSMGKRLNKNLMEANMGFVTIKPGHGNISNIQNAVRKIENNTSLVVHVGTNDVASHPAGVVIGQLRKLEEEIKDQMEIGQVAFSSVIHRNDKQLRRQIQHVNTALKLICDRNDWIYIDNNNITDDELWKDGLHLNTRGSKRLARNIINATKNFCFPAQKLAM